MRQVQCFRQEDPPGFQQTEEHSLLESEDGSKMLCSITPSGPSQRELVSLAWTHACLQAPLTSHGNQSHDFVMQNISFCFQLTFDNFLKFPSSSYITRNNDFSCSTLFRTVHTLSLFLSFLLLRADTLVPFCLSSGGKPHRNSSLLTSISFIVLLFTF